MPSWKKILVSGSSAHLNHITASGNISGSSTSTGSFGSGYIDNKLAIGTTSPSAKLHVNAAQGWQSLFSDGADGLLITTAAGVASLVGYDGSAYNDVSLRATSGTQLYLDTGGNVGIGTTGPRYKFVIRETTSTPALLVGSTDVDASSDGWTGILFGRENAAGYNKGGIFFQRDGADGYLRGDMIFALDNATDSSDATITDAIMTLTHGGKVGIGTTSPTETLHVEGSASFGGNYIINEQGRQDHVANTMASPYYRFDGSDDYINIDGVPTTAKMSAEFLVKSSEADTTTLYLFDSYSPRLIFGWNSSTSGKLGVYSNNAWDDFGDAPNDGLWHHIVFIIDGTTGSCYVDGVQNGSDVTIVANTDGTPSDAKLFSSKDADGNYFEGEASTVRLFNKALTATEVKELYSGASVPFKYKGANQTDMLTDGDMESDPTNNWDNSNATSAVETTIKHGGSNSLKIISSYDGAGIAYEVVTTLIGKKYRFNGWAYRPSASGTSIGIAARTAAYSGTLASDTSTTADAWVNLTGDFTATTTTTYIVLYSNADNTEVIYFDDVSIVPIGAVAEYDGSGATGTTWYDKSGNNLDGTVTGATLENKIESIEFTGNISGSSSSTGSFAIGHFADNVGIGTTSPGVALEVIGSVSGSSTSTGSFGAGYIDNKLGIGTTSPLTALHIDGASGGLIRLTKTTGATSGELGAVQFGNVNVDNYLASIRAFQDGATDSARIAFYTEATSANLTEKMRITSAGNVGIGTISPSSVNGMTPHLHIGSDSASTVGIVLEDDETKWEIECNGSLNFSVGSSAKLSLASGGNATFAGNVLPSADNSKDLGSASYRWANIYSADVQLSNEGTEGNEVDGTTGNWTIQEGEDDLYLLNRKNGKKYRFKLEEIK